MSTNRRVVVFAEYGWRNGGENSLLAVVKGLREKGWDFVFACPGETELSRYLNEVDIQQTQWNVIDEEGTRKSQDQIRDEMSAIITEQNPAIVHCNSLSTGRLAGPVTNEMQVPGLGYLRDIMKLSRKAISDLNHLNQIVAVSAATKEFHVAQGLLPAKVQVVHNGVDLDEFRPRDPTGFLHRELGLSSDSMIALCIGQIGLRKGTDTVIESFIRLCKEIDGLQLVLIGMRNSQKQESVDFESKCHRIGEESPFAKQIHWLGRRGDVCQILNEAKILLHGARQEPLGRVLLEASASGCPFVATRVGGTEEIVGDCSPEITMCDVDSAEQMTHSAKKILTDDECWQRISDEIRNSAESKFHDRRCVEDLNVIYQRLAQAKSN